jgi:hypothetical protein
MQFSLRPLILLADTPWIQKKDYLDGILLTYMVFSWRRLATQNEEMSVNN